MARLLLAVGIALAGGSVANAATVRDPSWSSDGSRLAYVRLVGEQGRVYVVNAAGLGRRTVTGWVSTPYSLSWSPDGSALAYVSGGDIWRVDVASGRRLDLTPGGAHYYEQPAWSNDGSEIAFVGPGEQFRTWNVLAVPATGGSARTVIALARRPRYQPSGSLLLVSDPPRLVDPSTGSVVDTEVGGSYANWSPTGAAFAFAGDGGVYVVAATTGEETVWPTRDRIAYPSLPPSGKDIAYVAGRRVILRSLAPPRSLALPRGDSANDLPAWSARGVLAYVASSSCGARTEIITVRSDGSHPFRIAGGC